MKSIILDWLNDDLKLEVTQKHLTNLFENGELIARILCRCKVINDNILNEIKTCAEKEEYFSNLIKLSYWLKLLGIDFNLETINELIAGKGTTSMQIMYQLYLSLNKINHRKQLGDITKRYEEYRNWCEKHIKISPPSKYHSSFQQKDWNYKSNTDMDVQSFNTNNYFVSGMGGSNGESQISDFHKNCTETEIDKLRKKDELNYSKTKAYTSLIKNKLAKEAGRNDMKTKLNNNIMNQVWNTINKKCEELHNINYCNQELLSSTRYKNEPLKIPEPQKNENLDTQQHYKDIELIDLIKEASVPKDVSDEVKTAWSYNFNRKLELHRKLWNERVKQQKWCRYKLCKELIQYCIDSAIEQSEKSLKNGVESIKYHESGVSKNGYTAQCENVQESIPIFPVMTRKYQKLEECCYDEYFYLTGDWFDQKLLETFQNFRDDGDNSNIVLGYLIHSLFESDDVTMNSKLMKYPVSCVVSNSPNASVTRKGLQAALRKSSILVVDRETAIDYCKKFYLENVSHPTSSKGKSSKKERKNGTKKVSKKSIRSQSIQKFKDEEVQVDEVPDPDELIFLDECIRSGKDVNDCLRTKSVIDSDLVVRCVASVLKVHQNRMRGWVVVNFPSSVEETCFFEKYLAGNSGRNNTFPKKDNSENLRNTFQADSLNNSSELVLGTRPHCSSLVLDPSSQCQYGQHKFITKYITMLQNENQTQEARANERKGSRSSMMETHFKKLGIIQEFQYEKIDKQGIINLAHAIIDSAVAEENFECVIDENALALSLDVGRPASKKKSKKNSQKKAPEEDPFLSDQKTNSSGNLSRNLKPGDANWDPVASSLNNDMKQTLKQFWRLTETSYIDSLEKIFSKFHQIEETVNLYYNYVNEKVKNVLSNNKERNLELEKFTGKLNEKACNLNQTSPMINVIDCDTLTSKLLFKLWNLSDLKRKDAEEIIAKFLGDFTTVVELMKSLWNKFATLMNVEMKRYIDTLIILQYYYLAVLKVKDQPILFFDKEFEELLASKSYNDKPDWTDDKSIEGFVMKNSDLLISTAQGMAKLINKLRKKIELELAKSTSIFSLPVSKTTALLNEWSAATDYEAQRIVFRLNLITRKVFSDLISINDRAKGLHVDLSSLVKECFLQDNSCCSNFSALIDRAHIGNCCLLGGFEFIGNEFYFKKNLCNSIGDGQVSGSIISSSEYFTLAHIEKMVVHFKILAPSGKINVKSLSFLLDDWNHKKSIGMLPDNWCGLSRKHIYNVLESISDENGTVDWRDFLLFGTLQEFPSKEELIMQYRQFLRIDSQQLGVISYEEFANNNSLWFGSNQVDRMAKVLFLIFETEDGRRFDYRSFLTQLCKDEDPALGFGKALSLRYNRCVIVTDEDMNCKKMIDESRECNLKIVKQILDQVVLDVINLTEFAIVYDYSDWEPDSVPIWRKLGRLPIVCPFKSSFSPQISTTERGAPLINNLRKLDWTNKVPADLFVTLLKEGGDATHMQCTENVTNHFNDNCTRLKNLEFIQVPLVLRKDVFVMDQISKDTRFKAISLPNLINKVRHILCESSKYSSV